MKNVLRSLFVGVLMLGICAFAKPAAAVSYYITNVCCPEQYFENGGRAYVFIYSPDGGMFLIVDDASLLPSNPYPYSTQISESTLLAATHPDPAYLPVFTPQYDNSGFSTIVGAFADGNYVARLYSGATLSVPAASLNGMSEAEFLSNHNSAVDAYNQTLDATGGDYGAAATAYADTLGNSGYSPDTDAYGPY